MISLQAHVIVVFCFAGIRAQGTKTDSKQVSDLLGFAQVIQNDLWSSFGALTGSETDNFMTSLAAINDNAYVAPSSKHGLGVFANKDLEKDTIITLYPTHAIGNNQLSANIDAEYFQTFKRWGSAYTMSLLHHSVDKELKTDVNPNRPNVNGWLAHRANDAASCTNASVDALLQYMETSLKDSNCMTVPFGNAAPIMALATTRAVSKDEELLWTYGPYYWLGGFCYLKEHEATALMNQAPQELFHEYNAMLADGKDYKKGGKLWRILQPFQESGALDVIEKTMRNAGFADWPSSRDLADGVKKSGGSQISHEIGHTWKEEKEQALDTERSQNLARLEQRLSGIVGIVESVDNGKISMPESFRDLADNLEKDTHSWLLTEPSNEDFAPKMEYIDKVMSIIVDHMQEL